MAFLNYFGAKNLTEPNLVEMAPWEFSVEADKNPYKGMPKAKRRLEMLKPATNWNVYTAVRGIAKNLRVSKTNPPAAVSAAVVDYDMVCDIQTVVGLISQRPKEQQANLIEKSLSNKIRLHWIFERPVLIYSTEFYHAFMETLFERLGVPTLLPGYDTNSLKPTEVWTNGAEWYDFNPKPLSWEFLFGVLCEVSKKVSLFNNGEIKIEVIAEEIKKRFPNKWTGDFALDSLGVRFWDAKADNPTGCQVKPDGMLCFTGNEPFVKWEQLFGRVWCEQQRVLNLGGAAKEILYDGRHYWEYVAPRWDAVARQDVILRLKGRGLSDRTARGATQSDVERVLDHIQLNNRVRGAAPLVHLPRGVVDVRGDKILNIADLNPTQPIAGPTGDPAKDFPWIWEFLHGLFPRLERLPLDHFLAWLRRSYELVYLKKRNMGQVVFMCGPKNNGKTLLCLRIVAPLLGNRVSNPINFLTGASQFNSDLFESALLAINDEDAPSGDTERRRMLAKIKGLVVNPFHNYCAKFEKSVMIDWLGRLFITLNDDPGSVGMLMEVEHNTRDKQMMFATQPYKGIFPPAEKLEAIVGTELPYFAHWLLNVYQPPAEVLSTDRMGVKSYFDPHILELSNQQTFSSNLSELLQVWMRVDAFWLEGANSEWTGTPTDLLSVLQTNTETTSITRAWSQQKIAKSLTALAKQSGSGIEFIGESGRDFKITK